LGVFGESGVSFILTYSILARVVSQ
jgi:hypothetical protein